MVVLVILSGTRDLPLVRNLRNVSTVGKSLPLPVSVTLTQNLHWKEAQFMYAFKYCINGFISSYCHNGLTNSPGDRTYICNHVENSLAVIDPIILNFFSLVKDFMFGISMGKLKKRVKCNFYYELYIFLFVKQNMHKEDRYG